MFIRPSKWWKSQTLRASLTLLTLVLFGPRELLSQSWLITLHVCSVLNGPCLEAAPLGMRRRKRIDEGEEEWQPPSVAATASPSRTSPLKRKRAAVLEQDEDVEESGTAAAADELSHTEEEVDEADESSPSGSGAEDSDEDEAEDYDGGGNEHAGSDDVQAAPDTVLLDKLSNMATWVSDELEKLSGRRSGFRV